MRPLHLLTTLLIALLLVTSAYAQNADPLAQEARGSTRAARQVELSAPLDGILKNVFVEEGDLVENGAMLMQMDDRLQLLRVASARVAAEAQAQIESAKLRVEESKAVLTRTQSAFEKKAAPEWEVFRATLDARLAEAALDLAMEEKALSEAELALAQQTLERYRVSAPFAGRVLEVNFQPGATLTRNDQVLRLVDLSELEAVVYAPAQWYGRLKVGEFYTLHMGVPVNGSYTAKLKTVDPVLDPGSQSFRCVLTINNTQHNLPAGVSVTLSSPDPVATDGDATAPAEATTPTSANKTTD